MIHPKLGTTAPAPLIHRPAPPATDDFGRPSYGLPGDAVLFGGEGPTQGQRPPAKLAMHRGATVTMRPIKGLTDPNILRVPFTFQLPPLETFQVQYGYEHTDYQTLRFGTLSRPVGKTLRTVTLQTVFVSYDHPQAVVRARQWNGSWWTPNPLKLTEELIGILNSGTPFELIAGQPTLWRTKRNLHWGPHTKNAATMRTLNIEERAGEPDARYVDVSFSEFRSMKLQRKGSKKKGSGDKPDVVTVFLNGDVRFQGRTISHKGTLHFLAKHFYGSSSNWRPIAAKNGIKNFAPSRDLGEWVKKRKAKSLKLSIPYELTGTGTGQGTGSASGFGTPNESGVLTGTGTGQGVGSTG